MKFIIFLMLIISVLVEVKFMAQLSVDNQANIKLIQKLALEMYKGNKVLADLTTAQAILESNLLGRVPSILAFKYNNLFGIKGRGTKGSVTLTTTEYVKGKKLSVPQPFAYNSSIEDSLEQRKRLFESGTHDNPKRYFKVLSSQTFEEAARAVSLAGYATDMNYSNKLIGIYRQYLGGK